MLVAPILRGQASWKWFPSYKIGAELTQLLNYWTVILDITGPLISFRVELNSYFLFIFVEQVVSCWKHSCLEYFLFGFRYQVTNLLSRKLSLWRHLFKSSLLLFSISSDVNIIVFSKLHSLQNRFSGLYEAALPKTDHDRSKLIFCLFKFHTSFDRQVLFSYLVWVNDWTWFLNLSLNVLAARPI